MIKFAKGLYADVRIEKRFLTQINYKNADLQEAKEISTHKAFIRVFDGKMWYYASTTDVDDIQSQLDALCEYATPSDDIENNPIVSKYQVNVDKVFKFGSCKVSDVAIADKHAILLQCIPQIHSDSLSLFTSTYVDRYSHYEFYSSKGTAVEHDYQTCGVRLSVMLSKGEDNISETIESCGTDFSQIHIESSKIVDTLAECERYLVEAVPVTAGKYPVVLSPMTTGVFAHESFGHKSEADFMLGDETMAKEWTLGKKVGSDILTIVDTGTELGSGYVPFDDEGTRATRVELIKDGVLCGRLHSATTATYLGEELTGNARAINCDFEPIVRMTSTFVDNGTSTVDELIAGIQNGFYVKSVKHGSGMSTFTIAPNIAYEIVDGKIGRPVKIAVLTGNVFETLSLIDGVANDRQVLSFLLGGCGKMEQNPLSVGLGGPHIRVSSMNVQ